MYFQIDGSSVRLGGTMHMVPTGRPLADWVDEAVNWARVIYLEHDKQKTDGGMFASPWSKPIAQRLPRSWPRIKAQYSAQDAFSLSRLRPGALAFATLKSPPTDSGAEYRALDRAKAADAQGLKIHYLETVEQLSTLWDSVHDDVWDEAATWGLDNPASMERGIDEIYGAWISGDIEAALRASVQHGLTRFAPIRHAELTARNALWMPRILELVRVAREPTLVLVGAAHLGGPDGLVAQLAASGLTLTPMAG